MRKYKLGIAAFAFALLAGSISLPQNVEASRKAVKVSLTKEYKKEVEKDYMVIKGYDKNNKMVWKYVTKGYWFVSGSQVEGTVHKNRVYVFAGDTLTVLKKKNGKKLWRQKTGCSVEQKYTFDKQNNIYITGDWGAPVVKINPKGTVMWSTKDNYECFGHGKIKYKKGKVIVNHDGNKKTAYSAKTGEEL